MRTYVTKLRAAACAGVFGMPGVTVDETSGGRKVGSFTMRIVRSLLFLLGIFPLSVLGQYSKAYQVIMGQNVFVLVLCNGKYQANFGQSRYVLSKQPSYFFEYNPQGYYCVKSDTLILKDTVYGNEYAYLFRDEKLKPIIPNYSFLLARGRTLGLIRSTDIPESICSESTISSLAKEGILYKRKTTAVYYVDTISRFVPASEYGMYRLRVKFSKGMLKVFWDGILLFGGNYVIRDNRIVFYDKYLKRSFIIFNGIKSFENIIFNFDRIIGNMSLEKTYSRKEWLGVIDSAAEFKHYLGGKGAGPDTVIIKE
jgi:hypothetical protein